MNRGHRPVNQCQKCGKTWGGLRPEHCRVCHETFSSTGSGDMHRVGDHGTLLLPLGRHCLSADEMRAKGLILNKRGVWARGEMTLAEVARASGSPEQPSRVPLVGSDPPRPSESQKGGDAR